MKARQPHAGSLGSLLSSKAGVLQIYVPCLTHINSSSMIESLNFQRVIQTEDRQINK